MVDSWTDSLKRLGVGAVTAPVTAPIGLAALPFQLRGLLRAVGDSPDKAMDTSGDGPFMQLSAAAAEANRKILETANKAVGLREADDWTEVGPEVLGGMVTGGGISRALQKGTEKLASGAARTAAKVGAGVAAPFPTTVKGGLAATGALTGLDQGIKSYLDSKVEDKLVGGTPEPKVVDPFDIPDTPAVAQPDPFDIPDMAAGMPQQPDQFDIPEAPEHSVISDILDFARENYKPIIAATGAAGAALYARRVAKMRSAALQSGELVGPTAPEPTGLTTGQKLKARTLDEGAALKESFVGSPEDKANFAATVSTAGNPVAVNHKITAALHDGDLPAGVKLSVTPKLWFDGRAMLSPDEAQLLNDGLIARSELVSRSKIQGYAPSFEFRSNDQLGEMVRAAEANPAVVKMMDHYDTIMKGMLDYMSKPEVGLLSAERANTLRTEFPHYVPYMQGEEQGFWKKLADYTMSNKDKTASEQFAALLKREGGISEVVDPGSAMEQYIALMIRHGEMNGVRRTYFDAMKDVPFIKSVKKEADDTIAVFRGGKKEFYRVTDPDIRSALENNPKMVAPMLNALRRVTQMTTTGIAAPWYAVKAMTYDALMASSVAPKGFGLVRGEPLSAIALAAKGATGAAKDHMVRLARDGFQKALLSSELGRPSLLAQVLPESMIQRLADITAHAYANSTLSLFERTGAGGGGRYTEHQNYRNFQSQMNRISPDVAASPMASRLINFYRAAMDSAQNAVRMEYMGRNLPKNATPAELTKLAAETRELTGDFARRGNSYYANAYAQTVPYGNVTVQSLARWGKAFKENPGGTLLGISNSIIVPTVAAQYFGAHDPAWLNYYNHLSMDEKNAYLYFYIPGVAPENMPRIAIPGEMQPVKAATEAMFDSLFGFSNGQIHAPEMADVKAAFEDLLSGRGEASVLASAEKAKPPMVPVGVGAVAALGGYDLRDRGLGVGLQNVNRDVVGKPQQTSNVTLPANAGTAAELVHSNYVRNLVSHLFGTLGTMAMSTLSDVEMGYRGTGDKYKALEDGAESVTLGLKQRTITGAPLWGQENAGMNTAEHRMVTDKIKQLGQLELALQAYKKMPQDQTMTPDAVQVVTAMSGYKQMFGKLLEQRTQLLKTLDTNNSNVAIGPTLRMENRNGLIRELHDIEKMLLEGLRGVEADVSQRFGRKITVDKLTPKTLLQDLPPN